MSSLTSSAYKISVGTDVRKLVFDKYPHQNIVAVDLEQDYIDLGFELYDDNEKNKITFFAENIFSVSLTPSPPPRQLDDVLKDLRTKKITSLEDLKGQASVLYTAHVFHLFHEEGQYQFALRLALLLKREKGSIIFGRHQGSDPAGLLPSRSDRYVTLRQSPKYLHDIDICTYKINKFTHYQNPLRTFS